jgi:riboflavin kinase/FMN adenylyltransferase
MRGRVMPGGAWDGIWDFRPPTPLERRRRGRRIFACACTGVGAPLPGWWAFARRRLWPDEALLEAHLFDFQGDLYGREIAVEFVAKLRDEAHFASLAALTAQMHADAAEARRILNA